jgi:membrane-associated protein
MKRINSILFSFVIAYSVLFMLSVLLIVPRYLSGGLAGFILALLTDTEPEGGLVTSFYFPLVWILIPLTSIGLCVMSWVSYSASTKSFEVKRLGQLGGTLFLAASIIPAVLVVREVLIFSQLGAVLPGIMGVLNSFVLILRDVINPTQLLGHRGGWAVPVIIFVETGLFFGFFLPGDSLLLTVGVLGAIGFVDLTLLIPASIIGAIMGDQLGYAIGRRSGDAMARRYRFVRENVNRASEFYDKHGGKAVVLARFVPVVRTFAPMVAGAARMSYSRFTLSNIAGGALWVTSITLAGYFVGRQVPVLADYLNPIILAVIISSPLVWLLAWIWGRTGKPFTTSRSCV